ncbi:MAG: nucleotide sugar dehydrogenase [Candidatus Pacebacteria bacterium]|nr:nucleotide sugar dehydrogenase [Candidatus Paceibacterota bacterium]
MKITVIGTGFVGVVSSAVFASLGHQVVGLDIDPLKVESLKQGQVPFFEPDLQEMLIEQQQTGNLEFTTDYQQAVTDADLVIIAVGTPSSETGQVNLDYVFQSGRSLAPYLKPEAIVAVKSTVPPGTLDQLKELIQAKTNTPFHLASLPEFLKEGSAVQDTLHPDRVVIGAQSPQVFSVLEKLHQPLSDKILKMSPESAQMAKYAANAYLATRITFINQIANLCEKNGADIEEVIAGIGADQRIGTHYWYPGPGYGGSCFPKDVKELAHYAQEVGEADNLLVTVNQLNQGRISKLAKKYEQKIGGWDGKKVAVLGLSFKPNTDDTREAPAGKLIPLILAKGGNVKAYDPMAQWLPDDHLENYQQVQSLEQAVEQADVILVLIEWPEITEFDYSRVKLDKEQWLIDTRNQLDPNRAKEAGYQYSAIGRN